MNTPASFARPSALDRRFLLGGLAGAAGVTALSAMARGGPLTPPAGPVAPSGKTLTEVEPRIAITPAMAQNLGNVVYNLTAPGSYYLTGDITVPSNYTGIFLWGASTLDLNGFTISGADGTGLGVRTTNGCTVRNGRIRNLQYGVEHYFAVDPDITVEDLVISNCSVRGIMTSIRGIVRRCTVTGPSAVGIECTNDYGLVEDCIVSGATGAGVYINSFSTMRGCKLVANGSTASGTGGGGAYAGYGSRIERCTFDANVGTGLRTVAHAAVESCSFSNTSFATGAGLELNEGGMAHACAFAGNPYGLRAGAGSRIAACSFDANTLAALKATGNAVHADGCTFTRNALAIDLAGVSACAITRSTLLGNTTVAANLGSNLFINATFANAASATNPLVNVVG